MAERRTVRTRSTSSRARASRAGGRMDAERLQEQAERIQGRVRSTVRAIRRRLMFDRQVKPLLKNVGRAVGQGTRACVENMRHNPVPWVLIGIGTAGVTWLI